MEVREKQEKTVKELIKIKLSAIKLSQNPSKNILFLTPPSPHLFRKCHISANVTCHDRQCVKYRRSIKYDTDCVKYRRPITIEIASNIVSCYDRDFIKYRVLLR
jgi:hypothetical protein